MELLHFALIVSLTQSCATSFTSGLDWYQISGGDRNSEYDGMQNYHDNQDYDGPFEINHGKAVWLRRILITKASHEWRNFKLFFRKNYSSDIEEIERVANYLATRDWVERHNDLQGENFKLVINQFADRSSKELQQMNGYVSLNISHTKQSRQQSSFLSNFMNNPAPESWDWRQHDGVLAEVKAQGECGSCWAFTVAALLEGQQRKVGMQLTQLSAQQLLDCETEKSSGCNGGVIPYALEYVVSAGGIEGWDTYPYEGSRQSCRAEPENFVMKGGPAVALYYLSEEDLKKVVAHYGPVATAIRARSDLYFWGSGIYDKCNPREDVDHAVLLVGYGKDRGVPYWIFKNSWGRTWGEGGYGKIKRGVNMCRVAEQPFIVQLGSS